MWCGVFVGVSGSGCGNAQTICFLFQSYMYLHDHVSRHHILKTCDLSLVSYGSNNTHTKVCIIWEHSNISWNYGHLKSTKCVAGKSNVVRPGSRYGLCGCVEKKGVFGSGCGISIFLFLFSSYLYMQPYSQTSHLEKLWNHMLQKYGYCNLKSSIARH